MQHVLTPEDKVVIEQAVLNPSLRSTIVAITGYAKYKIEAAITKQTLETFNSCGVILFGTKVKDAKIYIPQYLETHPELKDADPERCFTKLVYHFAFCAEQKISII